MFFNFKIIQNIYLFFIYLENQIEWFKHIDSYSKYFNYQKEIKEFKIIDNSKISITIKTFYFLYLIEGRDNRELNEIKKFIFDIYFEERIFYF